MSLKAWKSSGDPTSATTTTSLASLAEAQLNIGWYTFVMGHTALEWKGAQQRYYSWLFMRNTGKQWAITQLTHILCDMWEAHNGMKHSIKTVANDNDRPSRIRLTPSVEKAQSASFGAADTDWNQFLAP